MHICVVGGIFGTSEARRAIQRHTPETTLVDGLRARGHSVDAFGHGDFTPSERYDVIHVHHVGRAAYLMAATPTRTPFIFTGHDAKMLCGFERNPLRREAFRTVAHRCTIAVALSQAEAGFIRGFARPPRVEVIPNGVPAAAYEAADLDGPPVRSGILFAGQLIPMKGVETLLRAMKLLDRWPHLRLTLAYHNAQLEPGLKALADALGVASRVRFAGPQAPAQLATLYRASEAFVLPSYAESLPSVITEALLAGTPVVASAIGGVPEQIGAFGSLVAPGDPEELAAAISRWLANPPTPAARRAMREDARARFSPAAMVDAHVKLYESAASHVVVHRCGGVVDAALRASIWAYWSVGKRALRRAPPRVGPW